MFFSKFCSGTVSGGMGSVPALRRAIFFLSERSQNCKTRQSVSSRLSVRISHWTDFHEIWSEYFSENLSRKFKFQYNLTTITGTSREDQHTFLIISRSVLRGMRNVSDKRCRENQNTHFVFSNSSSKNRAVCEIMWKIFYSRTGHRWQYGECALHAG
jgi:hypothetical protein